MDYAEDDFLEETGYVDGYDMFGKGDGEEGRPDGYKYSYLGLDREDKVLEFESEYIRDKSTAEALRNFLYMFNCNQHNIFKINLPVSRYISLEAGDVVQFDSLIENVRAYGEDYTQEVVRNAQTIYPFFIITKITKKLKSIDIECMQLHDLTPFKFQCATGSLTRLQSVSDTGHRTNDDFFILENYLFGGEKYFTSTQKQVVDINNDGDLLPKLANISCPILFEGGSAKRDECWWMVKFKRTKMTPLKKKFNYKMERMLIFECE